MKKGQTTTQKQRKLRIKKGDMVYVIAGADKGKTGRVLEVLPEKNRVLVEGVRVARRSYKKGVNANLPQGGIHDKGLPIDASNVMLVDPKSGGPTRVGVRFNTDKDGNTVRVRYAKASDTEIKD